MKSPGFYITGGTLPRDAPSYVVRKADEDLFNGLREGQFCYVLTSRQMGKSSLMVRTAARLRQEEVTCAVLDLTAVGQDLTREQWYDGLQNALGRQLHLEDELEEFWLSHERLSPLQRWMLALEQVVLARLSSRIVIFVDEIDAVRSLPFSADEFFAGIREFYNRRTESEDLLRLTFCLLGVATPSDLIRDTRTTPFNLGHRIDLTDFSDQEASSLARGLNQQDVHLGDQASILLERVLFWTGGHPYLTQRLCQAVADQLRAEGCGERTNRTHGPQMVDGLCADIMVSAQARVQNDNLLFVRDRLLRSEVDTASLLQLYQRVLNDQSVKDDESDPLITVLRLSGISRSSGGKLHVRNRIYGRVFDQNWIAANLPDAEIRRQRIAYRRGLIRATALFGTIALALTVLGVVAVREAAKSRAATKRTQDYARRADDALKRANIDRNAAQREARRAQAAEAQLAKALSKAEERRKDAEHQKSIAGQNAKEANTAKRETSDRLRDSYLTQAQASHWSGRPGQKYDSLAALEKASRFPAAPAFRLKLRNEAIAAMALPIDLRLVNRRSLPKTTQTVMALDQQAERYVTVTPKGMLSIRRVSDGRELFMLHDTRTSIQSVTFSPKSRFLAIYYQLGPAIVKVWDLRRRKPSWESPPGGCASFDFGVNEGDALIGSGDGSVSRLNLLTGQRTGSIVLGTPAPIDIAESPGGKWLIGAAMSSTSVKLFNVNEKKTYALENPAIVAGAEWSGDGRHLAVSCLDLNIYIWDVAQQRQTAVLRGHLSLPTQMKFIRHGTVLISNGWDCSLRFWDIASGRQLLTTNIAGYAYAVTPDERLMEMIATSGDAKQTFEIDPGIECRSLAHGARKAYSADFLRGTPLLMTSAEDGIRYWDATSGAELGFLPTGSQSYGFFSPDGKYHAECGANTGAVSVRSVKVDPAGSMIRISQPIASRKVDGIVLMLGSLDGKSIVCGRDTDLFVLTLPKIDTRRHLGQHLQLTEASMSPDGRMVASSGHHAVNVKVWDVSTGKCVAELPTGSLTDNAFSPDGKWLVTGNSVTFTFWRVGDWRPVRAIRRAPGTGLSGPLAFTPDGRQSAIAYNQSCFELVDCATGEEIACLESPTESLLTSAAKFSSDGAYMASGTEDGVYRLWNLREIRKRLRKMGLDWNSPQPPPAPAQSTPWQVVFSAPSP